MVDCKAKLTKENYCDGLGDCLPRCPTNAITFEEREAPAYDEAVVAAVKQYKSASMSSGCPGMKPRKIQPKDTVPTFVVSQLAQCPCQIKLVPISDPYFDGASPLTVQHMLMRISMMSL